jgi:ABC-type sugar transport system substrate-binding protein
MFTTLLKLTCFLALFYLPNYSYAKTIKVVFLNPGFPEQNETGNFWRHVTAFMEAAAEDLDIDLITIYANRNHILMKSLVEEIAEKKPKYVVLVNEKGIALDIVKRLATHDIASFMLLNNLNTADLSLLTSKEKSLIKGSVIPNNYSAGSKLLNGLEKLYKAQSTDAGDDKEIKLLVLQGDYTTPASLERTKGFISAMKGRDNIKVIDSTVANWSKEEAYNKTKGILKHAEVDIIWAANDAMAFGAKKAVLQSNLKRPIVIGGVNWDVDDPHYPVNLSYGGHVALGAQSLIMIKDIENNQLDISKRHQVVDIFEPSLSPHYQHFTQRLADKKLGFYDFSRFSSSSKKQLTFTLENLCSVYKAN